MIALGLAIFCFILGGIALKRGRRGMQIDDHPHCARCKFDLIGLKESTCPECGTILLQPESRTIGTFRPRPRLFVAGGVFLTIGALLVAQWYFGLGRNLDWRREMPLWLVERQSLSPTPSEGTYFAREELLRRARAGDIPSDRLGKFVRALLPVAKSDLRCQEQLAPFLALATLPPEAHGAALTWAFDLQADRSLPFHYEIGKFLDAEFGSGRLSPEAMESYLRNAISPRLVLLGPATCSPGEKIQFDVQWGWRGGPTPIVSQVNVPGMSRLFDDSWSESGFAPSFGAVGGPVDLLRGVLVASDAPGTHEVNGSVTLALTGKYFAGLAVHYSPFASYPGGFKNIPPILVSVPISATYNVDPALPDAPSDLTRREIMRSISFEPLAHEIGLNGGRSRLAISIVYKDVRYTAEAELEWSDGTKRFPCGTMSVSTTKQDPSVLISWDTGRDGSSGGSRFMFAHVPEPSGLANIRSLHARFFNISVPGSPPTPIEPFELEFQIVPIK